MANTLTFVVASKRISDFPEVAEVRSDDLYPMSRESPGIPPTYKSYTFKYGNLYDSAITRDVDHHDFRISSVWSFASGLSVDVASTAKFTSADIATVQWFAERVYPKLTSLSTQMYGSDANHYKPSFMPSYVGMVVIGGEGLSVESQLKSVYGSNTSWRRITGRFILCCGENGANTTGQLGSNTRAGDLAFASAGKMGGTPRVKLQTKNIPSHTHVMTDNGKSIPYGKFAEREKPLETSLEGGGEYGIVTSPEAAANPDWTDRITPAMHTTMEATYDRYKVRPIANYPGEAVSIASLLGGRKEKVMTCSFQAKFDVGEMTVGGQKFSATEGHDNKPPYLGRYIWERTF